MSVIEIRGLSKSFGDLEVLQDVNFSVEEGERVVIIGGSGCGKSVFLRCIELLESPDAGKIFIDENGDYVPVCARHLTTKAKYCRVNHYTTRSYSEHLYKLTERGFADGLKITEEHRNKLLNQGQHQFNAVYDPIMLRYVPTLKNRMK